VVFDILDFIALVAVLIVLTIFALLVRRTLLRRRGASVACALRTGSVLRPGHGWRLGTMRYTPTSLEWFRIFSAAVQPKVTVVRHGVEIVGRRQPRGFELHSIPYGALVVRCLARTPDGEPIDLELAMGEHALTGFLSWLESAAPGAHQGSDAHRV
jgi:Protein of unknown function (DUF2550)